MGNRHNQIFRAQDIGSPKVEARCNILIDINPESNDHIELHPEGWYGKTDLLRPRVLASLLENAPYYRGLGAQCTTHQVIPQGRSVPVLLLDHAL